MKLACVIHRFGADIAGGSEAHCRAIALNLAMRHDVTIVTTCSRDHVTWRNEYPAGPSEDGPLRVLRFPVVRTRSMQRFRAISEIVFAGGASEADQERWFVENGPEAPALLEHLQRTDYDRVVFWSYRYYQTFFGLPLVADRSLIVPTAEEDPLIRLGILERFFALPRGFIFLTPEEEALIAPHRAEPLAPSCIIGSGLAPVEPHASVPLEPLGIRIPYVLYLGRIDPNKGCDTLLRQFIRFRSRGVSDAQLVMAGPANMRLRDDPSIVYPGFVSDATRETLLTNASVLVVPSPYESLSLVLLEAWNHGVPALVNGRCSVLKGQALRANGALYYHHFEEFATCLAYLLRHPDVARQLGRQGRSYVDREYRWPAVMEKLERFLERVPAGGQPAGATPGGQRAEKASSTLPGVPLNSA